MQNRLPVPKSGGQVNYRAYVSFSQCYTHPLTVVSVWFQARVVRYAFPVRLFHPLLHAGLSRRFLSTLHSQFSPPKADSSFLSNEFPQSGS